MRFASALAAQSADGRLAVIPDLKRRSPKEGDLFGDRDVGRLASALFEAGAAALSVVTEPLHFGGSMDMLRRAAATGLPVLRKDFVKTEGDIEDTARAGGAAVLLIASMMEEKTLDRLYRRCQSLGLDALVEVHTERELSMAAALSPRLVGINNRNILQLERDGGTVENTAALAFLVPRPALVVSESAISGREDARAAARAGADAILVGTALLKAEDIKEAYRALRVPKV